MGPEIDYSFCHSQIGVWFSFLSAGGKDSHVTRLPVRGKQMMWGLALGSLRCSQDGKANLEAANQVHSEC